MAPRTTIKIGRYR